MPNTHVLAAGEAMPAANVSRRLALLGGLSAAAALAVMPRAHAAPAEHPDAELFRLDKEMDKAAAAMKEALRACRRLDKKCAKLYPPAPANWEEPRIPEDAREAFATATIGDTWGGKLPPIYAAWRKGVGEQRTAYEALRIAHRAKVDDIQREVGADAAEEAFEASISAQYDVAGRILALPANTLAGVLVKLRMADTMDLQSACENDALVSIAADIRRLATVGQAVA
ncbi:hypothetical protein FJ976_24120 [Mesorhizobium sp. B1-1-9]|uniref:hypothetical protein n=1 Tax=Mesorhizobium sp. B1-1-9 TaxID=2589975 RepID=UPI00112D89A1|nr:hypothetical protein [Mesorhizobium sp. B1-1-9]TPN45324.1 hypothetical protein FJ976_24120 [Mesorhizobium sp. B1-1-9]